MKRSIILGVLFVALIVAVAAKYRDIVYTLDGNEYVGELAKITENSVVIDTKEGEMVFPADSVRSIDLGTWRPGDDWENRLDVDDPVLEKAMEAADIASREFTSAGYITLYEKGVLTVDADSSATYVQRYIYYIANERGKNKANWSENYFEDCQSIDVDFARVIGLSKVNTVADNAIEDGSNFAWFAEYQRQRRKKFAITGVSIGSIVDYQITKHYDRFDPFIGLDISWEFFDTEPILESEFEVRYHKNLDIRFCEVEVKGAKRTENDYIVKTYRMTDIEPYIEETMLPNLDWFMPNVRVTMPTDLKLLSAAYADKVEEATDAIDRVEVRLAEQFPEGNPTIEQVYNYVSENYTSNWVGMRNYYPYPKPLSKLLDAGRMARHELPFMLFVYLKAAGYKPELALVGPGTDTNIPPDMFNIGFFGNLTVRIDDAGTTRYLNPNEFRRYDNQHLDAVYVLPVRKTGAKLEKLDRLPGDHHYVVPHYKCKLRSDGTLEVVYTEEYIGPTGGDRYRYRKNDKPRELDNYFDGLAKDIDEMANIVDYELTGFKSLDEKVFVTYRVEIPGYAVRAGEEILAFRLPTVKFDVSRVGAAERRLPFSRPGNSYSEKHITIDLPEGYEIEFIPKDLKISVGYRTFKGDISVDDGVIDYTEISTGKHRPMLKPTKYGSYKRFVEKIGKFGDGWILIRKIAD
ncbi:hypothetical protein DRQ36_02115 [bacterium]|nr:MAG: hypothetical protein DRQ36_02115 [bacterium]